MKLTTIVSLVTMAAMQLHSVAATGTATSSIPMQTPTSIPMLNQRTSQGCFKSAGGNLTLHPVTAMSSGKCNDECTAKNFWVTALHLANCYCGWEYPPQDDLVENSDCAYPCPDYPLEACGGLGDPGYWSVFNTGKQINVQYYEPPKTTSSTVPASKTSAPSASSAAPAPETTSTSSSSGGGGGGDSKQGSSTNVAAIAGGVVSGIVVVAAVIGFLFFYMRRKRNAELEEEHRRNAAVNAFISGSKPPTSSSGSISMTDSRLDPVMAHRRLSDGSIADNEDYSRRILRVGATENRMSDIGQ